MSRATTAPISSSVCRLPFISASAAAGAHELDGLGGRIVAVLRSRRARRRRYRARPRAATSRMRAAGPTRIGLSRPSRAASTALSSEDGVAGMGDRGGHRRVLAGDLDQPLVLLRAARRGRWRPQARSVSFVGGRSGGGEQLLEPLQAAASFVGQARRWRASTSLHGRPARGPALLARRAAGAGWRARPAPRRGAAACTVRGTSP